MSYRSISAELSHKIILATAIVVLGGIIGVIFFSGNVVRKSLDKNARSSLNTYTRDVEGILTGIESIASFVSWEMEGHPGDTEFINALSSNMSLYNDMIYNCVISALDENDTTFDRNLENGIWSEPAFMDGTWTTSYSKLLRSTAGKLLGSITINVKLDKMRSALNREHLYEDVQIAILGDKGTIMMHPADSLIGIDAAAFATKLEDKNFRQLVQEMIDGKSGAGAIKTTKTVAIYGPVDNGWSIALLCPAKTLIWPVVRFQLLLLLIGIADLLFLYLVTKGIINRTLLPITEVIYIAKNIAKGNFKAKIPKPEGSHEMQLLHESLRNMLHSINDYISQLRTTTAANQRFESELSIASDIQQQMLRTDFINDNEVDLYATLRPAKEVGGDMYDFLRVGRVIYFAVGDVSGKGVPAALYMAISRSLFHYVSGKSLDTSNIVSCINSSFCSGNDSNMFITMFVGSLNLDTRELVFCNAGHNPIIKISPDGKASYIHAKSNLAAGVYDGFPYEKESIIVEKGSRLLIYTDGVTEAENAAKDLYGEDRLLAFADNMPTDTSSEAFVDKLIESIKAFTKENDQNDDITIMSVKV